jgi:hypothetical protein
MHKYRDWLPLYGDLQGRELEELDDHLAGCAECREELRHLNALGSMMEEARPPAPSPELLQEARFVLQSALRAERRPGSSLAGMLGRIGRAVRPPVRLALGGGVVFAAGFAAALLLKAPEAPARPPVKGADFTGVTRIENVRLVETDPVRNEVTCAFDMVRPSTLRGSVADADIQRVLLHALLNEQNPGTRLRSVNSLRGSSAAADPEVKRAMIQALAADENPGVRQEALKALQRLPFDAEIKTALLGVLKNEKNAALRIAAINALDSAKVHEGFADGTLIEALRQSMSKDANNYVRVRSKSVLEEIKEQ